MTPYTVLRHCAMNKSQHHLNMFRFIEQKFPNEWNYIDGEFNCSLILPLLFCSISPKRFFFLYSWISIMNCDWIRSLAFWWEFNFFKWKKFEKKTSKHQSLFMSVRVRIRWNYVTNPRIFLISLDDIVTTHSEIMIPSFKIIICSITVYYVRADIRTYFCFLLDVS